MVRRQRMRVGTRFHPARWNDEVGFLTDQSCPPLGDEQLSNRMAHLILKPWLEPVRRRVDVQGRELSYNFNPHPARSPLVYELTNEESLHLISAERAPVTTGPAGEGRIVEPKLGVCHAYDNAQTQLRRLPVSRSGRSEDRQDDHAETVGLIDALQPQPSREQIAPPSQTARLPACCAAPEADELASQADSLQAQSTDSTIYFPENAVICQMTVMKNGDTLETATVGTGRRVLDFGEHRRAEHAVRNHRGDRRRRARARY